MYTHPKQAHQILAGGVAYRSSGSASRQRLLSDLEGYIARKRMGREALRAAIETVSDSDPETSDPKTQSGIVMNDREPYGLLQKSILLVLDERVMSPGDIASEVARLRKTPVSQKSVGIAIHEMAAHGLVKMVGPAKYRKA